MSIDLSAQPEVTYRAPETLGADLEALIAIAGLDVRLGHPSDAPMALGFGDVDDNGTAELEVRVRPSTARMLLGDDRVGEVTTLVTDALRAGTDFVSLDDLYLHRNVDGRTVAVFRQALHSLAALDGPDAERSVKVLLGDGDITVELDPEIAWQIIASDRRVERLAEIVVALAGDPDGARTVQIGQSDRGLVVTSVDGETSIRLP